MTRRPEGLLVPVTTPFDTESGDVAPVHVRENARAILAGGASGMVAAGSTGEASLLSEQEFRQLVAWLRDIVTDEQWLIAGAGRESTRATIAACVVAAEEGADGVLLRAPTYYAPVFSPASLLEHFRRAADASPIPVLLYNFPSYTHVPLTAALVSALANHENIWGIKDSSSDLKNFVAYREAAPAWSLFMGPGALYYAGLEMGAAGAIAAVANFATAPTAEIGRAFRAGDRAAAGAAQERVAPLHCEIVAGLGVPGIKAAMDLIGLAGGAPRLPIAALPGRDRDRIATLLTQAGLLSP